MLNRTFDFSISECAFADADELIECAVPAKNQPKPHYMAKPILRRIPSLAVRRPTEQVIVPEQKPKLKRVIIRKVVRARPVTPQRY